MSVLREGKKTILEVFPFVNLTQIQILRGKQFVSCGDQREMRKSDYANQVRTCGDKDG